MYVTSKTELKLEDILRTKSA